MPMRPVCTACGEPIAGKPVWVQFADKGVRHPNELPFALHSKHYPKDGMVPAKEKVGEEVDEETGVVTFLYEDIMVQRYVEAEDPYA